MEKNQELRNAWDFVEHTGISIFLTGKAGTGKTTFLRALKEHSNKRNVIVAPTGVAAMNAGGMTIPFLLPTPPSRLLFLMRILRIDLIIAKRNARLCVLSTYLS